VLHTDRTNALATAAKQLDETTFAQRYGTSFLVFARPGEDLQTTEVEVQKLPPLEVTKVARPAPTLDENVLLDTGFVLEPIAGRWPGDLGEAITVGRARGNDIFIADPTVSKVHAFFRRDEEGVLWLFDQGSRNGTFVAGTRLKAGAQHKLGDSDAVTFGNVKTLCKSPRALHAFLKKATLQAAKSGTHPKLGKV
jgi:hypothetical protein